MHLTFKEFPAFQKTRFPGHSVDPLSSLKASLVPESFLLCFLRIWFLGTLLSPSPFLFLSFLPRLFALSPQGLFQGWQGAGICAVLMEFSGVRSPRGRHGLAPLCHTVSLYSFWNSQCNTTPSEAFAYVVKILTAHVGRTHTTFGRLEAGYRWGEWRGL